MKVTPITPFIFDSIIPKPSGIFGKTLSPSNPADVAIPVAHNTDLWNVLAGLIGGLKEKYNTDLILRTYEQNSAKDYSRFLQFPNAKIEELAASIVSAGDSNDVKMYKIEQWVIDNLEYVTDEISSGKQEYWSLPLETLRRGTGDCEDGAFLTHSLALNAGVPDARIRTYAGSAVTPTGGIGGHGWAAYQRETDNEWVAVDWTYDVTSKSIADRGTLAANKNYIDDWFYITAFKTTDASIGNGLRGKLINVSA